MAKSQVKAKIFQRFHSERDTIMCFWKRLKKKIYIEDVDSKARQVEFISYRSVTHA